MAFTAWGASCQLPGITGFYGCCGGQKWESEVRANWDHFLTGLLDALDAPRGHKKTSATGLRVERPVEKATQGGSRGIRGAGRAED